ncbi:MAG: GGDEF domain-containing protein [Planctomycetes bacterium]|nr:GGDEF domain-containing protein [Planctomycetota bacterium]
MLPPDPENKTIWISTDRLKSELISEQGRPVLLVLQGANLGMRYLLNERKLVIGRNSDKAQIVLPDPSVSSAHATIEINLEEPHYVIEDLGSRNGTFVNGQPVPKNQKVPIRDGDKIFIGETALKFTFQDEFEKQYYWKIDNLIHIDDLTGLVNKRKFDYEVGLSFEKAARAKELIALLMMDMDGLKKINDTHGHLFGAYCISEVGRIIGKIIQGPSLATRFGGDEFIAYLKELSSSAAMAIGEQIRKAVSEHNFVFNNIQLHPTISIGVASYPADAHSLEELVRKADEALYRAKNKGRNQVSL